MRNLYTTIAYAAIAIILTGMFTFAWYCEYANTPIRYTTLQTVDDSGITHDCLVVTYKKDMQLDCTHQNG